MTVIRMAKAKNKGPGKSGNRPAVLPSGELPAVPAERPWDQMSKGEKLSAAADMALDIAKAILELGVDARDPKILGHVKETALTLISQQMKVDQEKFRAARDDFDYGEFYRSYGSAAEPEGQGDNEHDE